MREPTSPPEHKATIAPARADLAFWICVLLAAASACWAILSVDYIPTNDGPQHVVQGYIENHYFDPGTIYRDHLAAAPQHASRGFSLLFLPLEQLMSWKSALRVSLLVIVLGSAAAFCALVITLQPQRRAVALLGFPLSFSWPFYMGFWPFAMGIAVGVGVVAFVLARAALRIREWALLFFVFALQGVIHVISAVMTLAVVGAVLLFRPGFAASARARQMVALLIAGAAVFVNLALTVAQRTEGQAPTPLRWEPLASWLLQAPQLLLPGPAWRAMVAVALILGTLIAAARRLSTGDGSRGAHRDERAICFVAIALLGLGVVMPFDLPGWQFFSPRPLWLGAILGMALLPIERLRAPHRRLALFAFTGAAVLSAVVSGRLHRRIADGCSDALVALDQRIERRYVQLPVTFDPFCGVAADPARSEVPHLAPLRHMAALYAASHGGTVTTMFNGNPSVHAFVAREFQDDLPIPQRPRVGPEALANAELRSIALSYFAGYGAFYESLLLFGATPRDIDAVIQRGFVPDVRRETFLMARFRGCPVELVIVNPPASGRLRVEHGVWPVNTAMRAKDVEQLPLDGEGKGRLQLERTPCGALWVHAAWRDARGVRRCIGVPPPGVITFEAQGEQTVVECTLDSP
jgi:hypothetical protein